MITQYKYLGEWKTLEEIQISLYKMYMDNDVVKEYLRRYLPVATVRFLLLSRGGN